MTIVPRVLFLTRKSFSYLICAGLLWFGPFCWAGANSANPNSLPTLSPMQVLERETAVLQQAMSNQAFLMNQAQQRAESRSSTFLNVGIAFGLLVVGAFAVRLLAPSMAQWFRARGILEAPDAVAADLRAEEQAFSKFAESFVAESKEPPVADAPAAPMPDVAPKQNEPAPAPRKDPVKEFLRKAPKEIAAMRAIFSGMGCAAEPAARQKILLELSDEAAALKGKSHERGLLPFWQMASALEGLLRQVASKKAELTRSGLHTIAMALDLLDSLCQPGVKPDLVSEPPARILAVDDDAVCRHTLSFALQKVLRAPDMASDGQAALAMVEKLPYDVIFLDIEMPGMDGFELCSRIRATGANKDTPVVFVTGHSGFDSRIKSSLSGGCDLIGKPFPPFELAVKALTMVMRRRLQESGSKKPAPSAIPERKQRQELAVTAA